MTSSNPTPSKGAQDSETAQDPDIKRIQHWSMYGRQGEIAKERVVPGDFSPKSFSTSATAPWSQIVPASEVQQLILGFSPQMMEDKWFVYVDGPDAQGKCTMHMHRSWTGNKVIEAMFILKLDDNGDILNEDAAFTEIAYEPNGTPEDAEEAKKIAKEVCVWVMGVKLP